MTQIFHSMVVSSELFVAWGVTGRQADMHLNRLHEIGIQGLDWTHTDVVGRVTEYDPRLLAVFHWCLTDLFGFTREGADRTLCFIGKRESGLGSTGVGRGLACPHTKTPDCEGSIKAAIIQFNDTDFEFFALDGERCNKFGIVVSPPDRPGDHLRTMEFLSRVNRMFQWESVGSLRETIDRAESMNVQWRDISERSIT